MGLEVVLIYLGELVLHQANQIEVQVCVLCDIAHLVLTVPDVLKEILDVSGCLIECNRRLNKLLRLFLTRPSQRSLLELGPATYFLSEPWLISFARGVIILRHDNILRL